MWLFFAFVAVPIIEIALFIQLGGAIGLLPTLAIVILTAAIGTYMVRSQGRLALANLRNSFENLNDPSESLAHGAMILFAGALLLTPGFFTDAVGFALLVPAFRGATFRFLKARINMQSVQMGAHPNHPRPARDDIIDTEYHEVRDPAEEPEVDGPKTQHPSGWTKH